MSTSLSFSKIPEIHLHSLQPTIFYSGPLILVDKNSLTVGPCWTSSNPVDLKEKWKWMRARSKNDLAAYPVKYWLCNENIAMPRLGRGADLHYKYFLFACFWPCSMRHLSPPVKPATPALGGKVLTTGLPEKSLQYMYWTWIQWQIAFSWAPKSLQTVTVATKLKDACSWEERLWQI